MATWPEYAARAGAALADWMTAHPWTTPADPDPDPDPGGPTPTSTVRINCGGPAVTVAGIAWEADRAYSGGTASGQGAGHYGADLVLETERWGSFSYVLTGLPPGAAAVRLHMADSYAGDIGPGLRKFDVAVQGVLALDDVDLVALAGGLYRPVVREVSTTVGSDGRLTVTLVTVVNGGCLQGLEVLAFGTGTPTDPGPGGGGGTGTTARWLSGGNPNNNSQDTGLRFGTWRGRPITAALCYPTREAGWGPLISATSGQPGAWKDKTIVLIVQMPFFPQGGGNTYAAAVRGDYDGQWQQLGRNWAARETAGFARPVFSPGWEANHNAMHYWGGPGGTVKGSEQHFQTYEQYIQTYRRFVATVRGVYPGARFAWVPNGHGSPGFGAGKFPAGDPRNIYPGDDVVDWIGVDYYDHYPPSPGGTAGANKVDFDVESRKVNGVRWYLDLARAAGKGFAVAEWACDGNNPAAGNGGGDNPSFIANMVKVFGEAVATGVPLIECYYDDDQQRMSIMGMTSTPANPKAAQAYLAAYRASA